MSSEPATPASAPAQSADQGRLSITDPRAMRALAHPVRMALLELLGVHPTLTATQASEALGESPATCAFHLRTLAKYGFVTEAGGGRGRERPWKTTHTTLHMQTADLDGEQARVTAEALGQVFLDRSLGRIRDVYLGQRWSPEWEEAVGMQEVLAFLTPAEFLAVRNEVSVVLRRHQDRLNDPALRPDGAKPVEFAFFNYPREDLAASLTAQPAPAEPDGQIQDIS